METHWPHWWPWNARHSLIAHALLTIACGPWVKWLSRLILHPALLNRGFNYFWAWSSDICWCCVTCRHWEGRQKVWQEHGPPRHAPRVGVLLHNTCLTMAQGWHPSPNMRGPITARPPPVLRPSLPVFYICNPDVAGCMAAWIHIMRWQDGAPSRLTRATLNDRPTDPGKFPNWPLPKPEHLL